MNETKTEPRHAAAGGGADSSARSWRGSGTAAEHGLLKPGNPGGEVVAASVLRAQAVENPGARERAGGQAALVSVTFKLSQLIGVEPDRKHH